jgi:hypothetical protein
MAVATDVAESALAAPPSQATPILPSVTVIPASTPVVTTPITYPLGAPRPALAIAAYFTVPVTRVLSLHGAGWGYGEIFRLHQLSSASGRPISDVQALRDSGLGWGQIAKTLGVRPGNAGINLGAAISDRQVMALTELPRPIVVQAGGQRDDGSPGGRNRGNGGGNGGEPHPGNGNGNGGNRGRPDRDR